MAIKLSEIRPSDKNFGKILKPKLNLCLSVDARRSLAGFTTIEIAVVIGITLFLSATLLTYNRRTQIQLELFRDQAVVVGALNRTKALAIEKFNIAPDTCGFGIHFTPYSRNFVIFQDLISTGSPNCKVGGAYQGNSQLDSGEEIETLTLSSRLRFAIADSSLISESLRDAYILFIAPDPTTTSTRLNSGGSLETAPLPITIRIEEGNPPENRLKAPPSRTPQPINPAPYALVKVSKAGQITSE
ncbi:hypothetical protein HY967_00835 [Candidatus Jorgensenbacteria bacterium]|nr:hypothetical protein [Candidatus Jorgensenbacteria bacterium]